MADFQLTNIFPANEKVLMNDCFLVLLHANRIPPHLLVSIHGKIFTLSVKGATVDGELASLLQLIRRKKIETVFIRLSLPPVFTFEQLQSEIRQCTLAYPRVDVGMATCLAPIRDFCGAVYKAETGQVNLVFDLISELRKVQAVRDCFHLNLDHLLVDRMLVMPVYRVNDVYEAIRRSALEMA